MSINNNERSKKLFGLFRSKSTNKADPILSKLGSGTAFCSSITSSFDPYSPPPNLQQKRTRSKSLGRETNVTAPSSTNLPPPLPAIRKYASAHDLRKTTNLQRHSVQLMLQYLPSLDRSKSLSSKSIEPDIDDDDNIPLGYLQPPIHLFEHYNKRSSLLSDREEEDDKDLLPIAITTTQELGFQSAADKYKERVKEKLNMRDDDNTPISSLMWKK